MERRSNELERQNMELEDIDFELMRKKKKKEDDVLPFLQKADKSMERDVEMHAAEAQVKDEGREKTKKM